MLTCKEGTLIINITIFILSNSFIKETTQKSVFCQTFQPEPRSSSTFFLLYQILLSKKQLKSLFFAGRFKLNHGLHRQHFSHYIKFFYQRNNSKVCFLLHVSTGPTVFIGDIFPIISNSFIKETTRKSVFCRMFQPEPKSSSATFFLLYQILLSKKQLKSLFFAGHFNRNHGLHQQHFSYYIKFFYQRNNSKVCFLPHVSTGTTVFISNIFPIISNSFIKETTQKSCFIVGRFNRSPCLHLQHFSIHYLI